ncbi:hypothetical protein [Photobacterium leiognathi]|uniref:hypothetical protein n=1 Tax=Photobacterium leiognathi TaxID=553611 RepID=UPI002980C0AB|nr:hypothetical protein [Photobacterium leiognathi]
MSNKDRESQDDILDFSDDNNIDLFANFSEEESEKKSVEQEFDSSTNLEEELYGFEAGDAKKEIEQELDYIAESFNESEENEIDNSIDTFNESWNELDNESIKEDKKQVNKDTNPEKNPPLEPELKNEKKVNTKTNNNSTVTKKFVLLCMVGSLITGGFIGSIPNLLTKSNDEQVNNIETSLLSLSTKMKGYDVELKNIGQNISNIRIDTKNNAEKTKQDLLNISNSFDSHMNQINKQVTSLDKNVDELNTSLNKTNEKLRKQQSRQQIEQRRFKNTANENAKLVSELSSIKERMQKHQKAMVKLVSFVKESQSNIDETIQYVKTLPSGHDYKNIKNDIQRELELYMKKTTSELVDYTHNEMNKLKETNVKSNPVLETLGIETIEVNKKRDDQSQVIKDELPILERAGWAGTSVVFIRLNNNPQPFSVGDSIPEYGKILSIAKDKKGVLRVSTEKGIVKFRQDAN